MERLFDEDEPYFATWLWLYDLDSVLRARPGPKDGHKSRFFSFWASRFGELSPHSSLKEF